MNGKKYMKDYKMGRPETTRNKNGKLHSFNDEPAVYTKDFKCWFKNGKLHRDNDKPAMIWNGRIKKWFKNGEQYRQEILEE